MRRTGRTLGLLLELVLTVPLALDHALGGEPIAAAARRQLRRFFDKLLAREEAVRDDEDMEDVHQMRSPRAACAPRSRSSRACTSMR